jgi:hypothetical protein
MSRKARMPGKADAVRGVHRHLPARENTGGGRSGAVKRIPSGTQVRCRGARVLLNTAEYICTIAFCGDADNPSLFVRNEAPGAQVKKAIAKPLGRLV